MIEPNKRMIEDISAKIPAVNLKYDKDIYCIDHEEIYYSILDIGTQPPIIIHMKNREISRREHLDGKNGIIIDIEDKLKELTDRLRRRFLSIDFSILNEYKKYIIWNRVIAWIKMSEQETYQYYSGYDPFEKIQDWALNYREAEKLLKIHENKQQYLSGDKSGGLNQMWHILNHNENKEEVIMNDENKSSVRLTMTDEEKEKEFTRLSAMIVGVFERAAGFFPNLNLKLTGVAWKNVEEECSHIKFSYTVLDGVPGFSVLDARGLLDSEIFCKLMDDVSRAYGEFEAKAGALTALCDKLGKLKNGGTFFKKILKREMEV